MSYESIPKMKNKATICQPITTVQRRLAVSRIKVHFRYKDQHLILICLAMISFTSMLAMAIIAPFFPKEAAMKGMPESVNGMVFSVYALVLMLFSPLMSVVIPMVGTKLTLIMGVFVAAVANILFGLLDQVHDLRLFTFYCFLVRIFEAIGATAFSTATYTILMEEFPKNIGTAFVSGQGMGLICPIYLLWCVFVFCVAEHRRDLRRPGPQPGAGHRRLPLQHRRLRAALLRPGRHHARHHSHVRRRHQGQH